MKRTSRRLHHNIPIFIPHLGCPYDCIYCDQKIIANQAAVPRPDQIGVTIERYLTTIPASAWTEVAFFGGSFTALDQALQEEYLGVVKPYLQRGRINGIRVSTRPDCINEDNLDLLASCGVSMVELGVQSMCDEVLKESGRVYDSGLVRHSCMQIKGRDIRLGVQLMIGLPGDTPARDMISARETVLLRPQAVRIYPTLVLAGTKLAAMYRQGRYTPWAVEEAVGVTKEMYLLFSYHGIPVIRMGLHPGPELHRPGNLLAGPFHSSFGELVEQAVFQEQAYQGIRSFRASFGECREPCLHVHHRDLSQMIGWRRSNIIALCHRLGLDDIEVRAGSNQSRGSVGVGEGGNKPPCCQLSRRQYLAGRAF